HTAAGIALRHLLVENAATGGHTLHVAGTELALVAEAVAVVDRPRQDIRDGLDAAVWVPWEPGPVVVRAVVAEIVEQQERIEFVGIAEPEGAVELHPGAFHGGGGFDDPLDWSNGHVARPCTGIAAAYLGMKERIVQTEAPRRK